MATPPIVGGLLGSILVGEENIDSHIGSVLMVESETPLVFRVTALNNQEETHSTLDDYAQAIGYTDAVELIADYGYVTELEFVQAFGFSTIAAFLEAASWDDPETILSNLGVTFS